MMARLLAEARGREKANLREKASLKEEKEVKENKEVKEDEELEEKVKEQVKDKKEEMNMGEDEGRRVGGTEDRGLLVHGLKGRKPKLSEEKKDEILTEETVRLV